MRGSISDSRGPGGPATRYACIVVIFATLLAIVRWIRYSPSYTIDGWEYLQAARYISQGNYLVVDTA